MNRSAVTLKNAASFFACSLPMDHDAIGQANIFLPVESQPESWRKPFSDTSGPGMRGGGGAGTLLGENSGFLRLSWC